MADIDEDDSSGTLALVVRLNGEALAIPVAHVHEVLDTIPRTRVPRATPFAPWLINVRGAVVPLVDIRRRLRMAAETSDDAGRIVVLELQDGGAGQRLAMLADAVEEVVELDLTQLRPLPEQGCPWPETFVRGAIRRDDGLLLLLEPENLFRPEQAA